MSDRNTTPERDSAAPEPSGEAAAVGRSRRWLFRLGAVLVGLAPLVILEAGLRLFDLGRPADPVDPFAGFSRHAPLFESHDGILRTARARAPFVATQEFPVAKPPGSRRIFCFGGSTVYGHPYLGDTAFPKWLELELAGSDPKGVWQAINCGGISYASYRIVPLVREVLQYQPDLIIVATGHNEFLEDRTYHAVKSRLAAWAWLQERAYALRIVGWARTWLARGQPAAAAREVTPEREAELGPAVNTRLDNASGYASYHRDPAWHERVVAQYDESVRTIVSLCQAARVPLLLVRLGSNLRDCPPFKSEHRAGLAPERESDWQAAFDRATALEKPDPARALQYYQEALAIDGEHALLNFRVARLLDRLGRTAEARRYFEQARDKDICPLRLITPVEQALQRIATATGTPLVDAANLLAARSPDGIPGNDWYVDHVHPTIGGHQLIARALAEQLRARGLVASAAVWPEPQRRETYARHLEALGPAYFADGARRVGWLEHWAQRKRLAEEALPHDARSFARWGFLRLDLGDEVAAWEALREALKRDRAVAGLIRERATELEAEGRAARAAALLRQLN